MYFSVNKKSGFNILVRVLLVFSLLIFSSCDMDDNLTESFSDQDSYEAKLDEAVILMDKQKYLEAKDIIDDLLLEKPDDDYLLELRASCYVGLAGMDSLTILEKIDEIDDAESVDASDIISTILGDDNGDITTSGLSDILDNLDDALEDLSEIDNPTDGQLSQIALFSAYRILANVADLYMDNAGITTLNLDDELDFTSWDENDIEDLSLDPDTEDILDEILTDINNMLNVPESNPLYDPLHELLDEQVIDDIEDVEDWLKQLDE